MATYPLPPKHVYETLVLEKHLDTFGHVNNAVYLQLLEEARWDLITPGGFGLERVQREQIGPTILGIEIRFKRELRLREKIRIETQVTRYHSKIGELVHTILNEAGEICCEATFRMGLFDLRARKLIDPTPEWLRAIGVPGV